MPARLRLDAMPGVDEQDRHICVAGSRGHVARVLLVAGAVDDDEPPGLGVEIAPGDVDGNALFALGDKTVHQQRKIGVAAVDLAAAL